MDFWALGTSFGTDVSWDASRAGFVHGQETGRPVLYRPEPSIGFLFDQEGRGPGGTLRPVRIGDGPEPGSLTLMSPLSGRYWCSELPAAPGLAADVVDDRPSAGAWETFTPRAAPRPLWRRPGPLLRALAALFAARPGLDEALASLAPGGSDEALQALQAYLVATMPDLGELAAALADRPDAAAALGGQGDPWLAALPDLKRWTQSRGPRPTHYAIGPELDILARAEDGYRTLGRHCGAALRERVGPRRAACIVASARNEGRYVLEWLAHHRAVGFQHAFLYGNDNDDGSDDLLGALARHGAITWIANEVSGAPPQQKSYGHALGILPEVLDYRWALVIDLDEFVVLDRSRFAQLADYLVWHEEERCDAIALNWLLFGTFGMGTSEGLVSPRFVRRFPDVDPHIKTMFDPRRFDSSTCHYPVGVPRRPVGYRDSERRPYRHGPVFPHASEPVADTAWINHYFSKSLEDAICKFSRNYGDRAVIAERPAAEVATEIFNRILAPERGVTPVVDRRAAQFAPEMQRELATLRALPGVAEAEARVAELFARRIGRMRERILGLADGASPEVAATIAALAAPET